MENIDNIDNIDIEQFHHDNINNNVEDRIENNNNEEKMEKGGEEKNEIGEIKKEEYPVNLLSEKDSIIVDDVVLSDEVNLKEGKIESDK